MSDPRLVTRVTLSRRNASLPEALAALSAATHISYVAEDNAEVTLRRLTFSFEATPLRDLMDAVASLYGLEWERRKSGVFVLRAPPLPTSSHQKSPAELEIERRGRAFDNGLKSLPSDVQAELTNPEKEYRFPVGSLPPGMQEAIRGMLAAQILRWQGEDVPAQRIMVPLMQRLLGDLSSARIVIQGNALGIGNPDLGSTTIRFRP